MLHEQNFPTPASIYDRGPSDSPVAPDCSGMNFFDIDRSLISLLDIYLEPALLQHMLPHYREMGRVAGGRLDDLARTADIRPPVLHPRDGFGRDGDWIEFHPSYHGMEQIVFRDFGLHCMSRKSGVLGWKERVPQIAKYVFAYLFAQSEFGLMCPVSGTENCGLLVERHGDEALKAKYLHRILSQDMDELLRGAIFMTEKSGGSDLSGSELEARFEDGEWRLYGEKWFCSVADFGVALLLARPAGAPRTNRGLALFLMPRHLDDGSRNAFRTARLKDKLGSRGMASSEVLFEGAVAYPLGEIGAKENFGLKKILDQTNRARVSLGVRAAALMRRCLNEAMVVAHNRTAFGSKLIDKPLMRRQLLKMITPTEQALSVSLYASTQLDLAEAGDPRAKQAARVLTPMLKFRAARDNVVVATASMETRGGNGYVEDWVNAKLVRDSHLGIVWEGTSNINALDAIGRSVGKDRAHLGLQSLMDEMLDGLSGRLPAAFHATLREMLHKATAFAEQVADGKRESMGRQASTALYNAVSAILLANEGTILGERGGDARRILIARLVVDHRLRPQDPMTGTVTPDRIADLLLQDGPVALAETRMLVEAA